MDASKLEQRAAQITKKWKPDTMTATGGVLHGVAIHREQPRYPGAAKAARLSGTVFIKVVIDEMGKVTDATIVCGADLLAVEAREAARKWRFKPTMVEGKPAKVQGILTFHFTLQ
jgi:protein TonB